MSDNILIVDTVYPGFLEMAGKNDNPKYTYYESLKKFLGYAFGTADFYSKNLGSLGLEAFDVIANADYLQRKWRSERGKGELGVCETIIAQAEYYDVDAVFFQDLSLPNGLFKALKEKGIRLAGQCSCPMPPEDNIKMLDVIFTSFPHYIKAFEVMGVKAIFNKLAFEPDVLNRLKDNGKKYDITFVGGVGRPSHWKYGLEVLEAVAREFPDRFKWWGYGTYREDSPLAPLYQGQAWGLDMYQIYKDSRIVVNRHGEVAKDYANNMRMYEATGCGACLVTDHKSNISDIFDTRDEIVTYRNIEEIIDKIHLLLNHKSTLDSIARHGQMRTKREHNYRNAMLTVAEGLESIK